MPIKTNSFVEDLGTGNPDEEMECEGDENPDEDADGSASKEKSKSVGDEPPAKKRFKRDLAKEAEKELPNLGELVEDINIPRTVKFARLTSFLDKITEDNVNTLQFELDFNDWTKQKLLKLIEETDDAISEEFYKFLCSVLTVTPMIIESICEKILAVIYLRHCPKISIENDLALENFLEKLSVLFEKLHRYPKLIAKLLCCTRDHLKSIIDNCSLSRENKKSKKRRSLKSKTPVKEIVSFILPPAFMNSFCSCLTLLPAGQVMDLWKTLDHNLVEECVKKLKDSSEDQESSLLVLLSTVVKLIEAFLLNVKVADYSVPNTTVEKVGEMMSKLRDVTLPELGLFSISPSKSDFIVPFLELSYAWGTLHEFILIYNSRYSTVLPDPGANFQEAEDLSYFFPFLSSEQWISLWKLSENDEDSQVTQLLVSLVALKLKCLTVIDQQRREMIIEDGVSLSNELKLEIDSVKDVGIKIMKHEDRKKSTENLNRSIEASAEFVWTHQHHLLRRKDGEEGENIMDDILDLASTYMDSEKIIECAKSYLSRILSPEEEGLGGGGVKEQDGKIYGMQSITNIKFQVALILEALHKGVKSFEGMKQMKLKRPIKKYLKDFMNAECKKIILEDISRQRGNSQAFSNDVKNHIQLALQTLNESIDSYCDDENDEMEQGNQDHMLDLLNQVICFLHSQALDRYPKVIKTVIFLSCSMIMVAVLVQGIKHQGLVSNLVSILSECGRNSHGNEFLFLVDWMGIFDFLIKKSHLVSFSAMEQLCFLALENIYVSPKNANTFGEKYLDRICDTFELNEKSEGGNLAVSTFAFIMQEVIDGKSKSTSLLQSHTRKIGTTAVSKLSDGSIISELHGLIHGMKKKKKKGGTSSSSEESPLSRKSKMMMTTLTNNSFVSNVMQTCYLLLKGKSLINAEDASEYNVIVLPYLQFALDFLEVCKRRTGGDNGDHERIKKDKNKDDMIGSPLFYCLQLLIETLKSFEQFRAKLPQDFLSRLWDSCAAVVDAEADYERMMMSSSKKETGSLKTQSIKGDGRSRRFEKGVLKLILEVANEDEFRSVCDSTKELILGDETELSLVAHLLSSLIDAEIKNMGDSDDSSKKKQLRRETVELCLYTCLEKIGSWKQFAFGNDDDDHDYELSRSIIPYVQFQAGLLRRRKPMCNLNSLAVCLSTVTAVPLDKIKDLGTFKTMFLSVGDLLNALAFHRVDVLSFRTHIFLQCFQFLAESLVKRADQRNKLTDSEIYDLRQCAHTIERICQSAKLGKHEFARVSPYLIVTLLQQFDKTTVYPVVKNPLLSGCYKLLDMCDDHGVAHVNSMLSQGSREVFKAVYETYNRFYRYKGKA